MKNYEYDITRHKADEFQHVNYFCNSTGECSLETIPSEQTAALISILNSRGREGWELIQTHFGEGGMLSLWKREV